MVFCVDVRLYGKHFSKSEESIKSIELIAVDKGNLLIRLKSIGLRTSKADTFQLCMGSISSTRK